MMIRCSKTLWKELIAVADICFEEKIDINELMEKMIRVEYVKDARINDKKGDQMFGGSMMEKEEDLLEDEKVKKSYGYDVDVTVWMEVV
ncbi:hypothetical protein ES705_46537 [subsurface metagenome]